MSDEETTAAPPLVPTTKAGQAEVQDGEFTWTTTGGTTNTASVNEIVFILEASTHPGNESPFIIFFLRESDADSEPFKLLMLSMDKVPSDILQRHRLLKWPSYLSQGNENSVDVVVSTKSGTGLAEQFWKHVLNPLWEYAQTKLQAQSVSPNVIKTETAQSVKEFAGRIQSRHLSADQTPRKPRTIVLLSGDGGVVDLLNGREQLVLDGPSPLISLLPLGTGNALFHTLHKPVAIDSQSSPLVLGLRTLFRGAIADLPVFRASFSPGSRIVSFSDKDKKLNQDSGDIQTARHETAVSHLYSAIVVSYGFHASIVYESDTPEYRKHGSKRFGLVAQELLRESHPYLADVETRRPGEAISEKDPRGRHAYVLVTPLSNLERTFTISPASKPLDKKLRLVQFGAIGGERTMDVMMKAYDAGKHVDMKWDDGEKVRYEEVEEIKIVTREDSERWRKVCVDGTIVEIPKNGDVSVKKAESGAFTILVDERVLHQS